MGVRTAFVRELPIAAASGVVRVGTTLFVVADDEHRLVALEEGGAVGLVPFADELAAADPGERKRAKRDVEALTVAGTTLLALGSGSTPRRRAGFAWPLTESGALAGDAEELDLSPLYEELDAALPDLNVEGATFTGDRLLLFQRGNGPGGVNAVVTLSWCGDVRTTLRPEAIEAIERHELGHVGDVRLGFTDAACAGETVVFTAVAEGADSTYDDGPFVGAVVGILGGPAFTLDPPAKVEGVEVVSAGRESIELLLVVDDDDPSSAAQLLSARLDPR